MYAIVKVGGKQYRAEVGKPIVVEKLPFEAGESVVLDQVLLISDGEMTQIGQPTLAGAQVSAEVVSQFKGKKVIIFKYRPKKRFRRKQGHRQNYTRLMVNSIVASGSEAPAKKARATRKKAAQEET